MTPAERREEITAQVAAQTGITERMIEQLLRAFNGKVRADDVLGPIFEGGSRIGSRIFSRCSLSGRRSC